MVNSTLEKKIHDLKQEGTRDLKGGKFVIMSEGEGSADEMGKLGGWRDWLLVWELGREAPVRGEVVGARWVARCCLTGEVVGARWVARCCLTTGFSRTKFSQAYRPRIKHSRVVKRTNRWLIIFYFVLPLKWLSRRYDYVTSSLSLVLIMYSVILESGF